jgi:hypothetical protein
MDITTVVTTLGAVLFGTLWILRRRSRMRSEDFE